MIGKNRLFILLLICLLFITIGCSAKKSEDSTASPTEFPVETETETARDSTSDSGESEKEAEIETTEKESETKHSEKEPETIDDILTSMDWYVYECVDEDRKQCAAPEIFGWGITRSNYLHFNGDGTFQAEICGESSGTYKTDGNVVVITFDEGKYEGNQYKMTYIENYVYKEQFTSEALEWQYTGDLLDSRKIYTIYSVSQNFYDKYINGSGYTESSGASETVQSAEIYAGEGSLTEEQKAQISFIKEEFQKIQNSLDQYEKYTGDYYVGYWEYSDVLEMKTLRKVIASPGEYDSIYPELHDYTTEYYYDNAGRLLFVYTKDSSGKEYRYYMTSLDGGSQNHDCIRYIDPDGYVHDFPNGCDSEEAHETYSFCYIGVMELHWAGLI